jgi:hypothetical protein
MAGYNLPLPQSLRRMHHMKFNTCFYMKIEGLVLAPRKFYLYKGLGCALEENSWNP